MTTFAGYLIPVDGDGAIGVGYPAPYGPFEPLTADAGGLADGAEILGGAFVSHQPLDLHGQSLGGSYLASFTDDFYNHIHLVPAISNFGTVGSQTNKTFTIWNAYFTSKTLGSLTPPGTSQGVSITGLAGGTTLKPLEYRTFTVTAAATGDRTISSTITFSFTGLPDITMAVAGVRATLFNLAPNWSTTYKVTREYKTTIQISRSGKEQRRAMRSTPRKSLDYEVAMFNAQVASFNRYVTKTVGHGTLVADESRYALTTADTAANSTTLVVDAIPFWAIAEANVTVRGGGSVEERQIESVSGSTITFTSESGAAWPKGTQVMPMLSCRMKVDGQNMRFVSSEVITAQITFDIVPLSEIQRTLPAADVVFNGREVFLLKPNWAQIPDVTFSRPFNTVDYGQGAAAYFNRVEYFSRLEKTSYLGITPAKVVKCEDLFDRMKGRRGEFYKPTWINDIPVWLTPANAGSSLLRVPGGDLADLYSTDTVYRAIYVEFRDGSYDMYQIHRVYLDETTGDSVIELLSNLVHDLDPDTVTMICWMPVHRFASDAMTTEWVTNTIAQIQWTMVTLEDLPPETL